jgi:glycosyltransferase involved in cell wall biosynthesis
VDDGSTDDTLSIIREYDSRLEIIYDYIPRTNDSSRGKARNRGITLAKGDVICFLDTGVLLNKDFVRITLNNYCENKDNLVVCHYVYSLFLPFCDEVYHHYMALSTRDIESIHSELAAGQLTLDTREAIFKSVKHKLNRLATPWSLCFTCALSVSRSLALKSGGFDEEMRGWGSEDQDFGYRMNKLGAEFTADDTAYGVHIPHITGSDTEKRQSAYDNRLLMCKKHHSLEIELFSLLDGCAVNYMVSKLNGYFISSLVLWSYNTDVVKQVNKELKGRSLAVGFDRLAFYNMFKTSCAFVYNKGVCDAFIENGIEAYYLLGCNTNFADKHFDTILVTDFIRFLDGIILEHTLLGLKRIGGKLIFLFTPNPVTNFPMMNIHTIDEMIKMIKSFSINYRIFLNAVCTYPK